MLTTQKMKNILYFIAIAAILSSCQEFLDAKPNKSIVVPGSLQDMQAILDNSIIQNNTPTLALLASDDFYTNDEGFNSFELEWMRKGHTWQQDAFIGEESVTDWQWPYQQIFYTNIVFEQADNFVPANQNESQKLNEILGEAHFKRAYAYFYLIQVFTPPYDPINISTENGIPIKKDPNVNNFPARSSLMENYNLILDDMDKALELLPESSLFLTKPNRKTAHAFLSRIYLSMGDFGKAEEHADQALGFGYSLLPFQEIYNGLEFPLRAFFFPIPRLNSEIVYFDQMLSLSFLFNANFFADSTVFNLYNESDLRRHLYYYANQGSGGNNFIGNLTGDFRNFSGISITEILLTKAECLARKNEGSGALEILNTIARSRSAIEGFNPLPLQNDMLSLVLEERRKELIGQGYLRWMDLRRFSREPTLNKILTREFEGNVYSLDLRSSNFCFPIPPVETDLNERIN